MKCPECNKEGEYIRIKHIKKSFDNQHYHAIIKYLCQKHGFFVVELDVDVIIEKAIKGGVV